MDLNRLAAILDRHIERDPNSGCWLWSGPLDAYGYGHFGFEGRTTKAHRAAFLVENGSLDGVEMVCHHCDVRACINPAHLYAGDARSNAHDRDSRGRLGPRDGENNGRAKLTVDQVAEIREVLGRPLGPGRQRRPRGTMAALARQYGVYRTVLHRIATGEIWSEAA